MSALLFSFNGWADEIVDPLEGFATPVEDDFWDRAIQESQKVVDKSSESISSAIESMMQAVDKEIENLKKSNVKFNEHILLTLEIQISSNF